MTLAEALDEVTAERQASDMRCYRAFTQGVDVGTQQAIGKLMVLACELPPGPEQDTLMGAVTALRMAH